MNFHGWAPDVAGAALASEPRASRAGQYEWYGQAASPPDRDASVVSRPLSGGVT